MQLLSSPHRKAQNVNPPEEQQQKEKAEKEKKAYALLEQVVDEAQLLKLPENRVRVQIGAADLFWERNEGRARTLFALAVRTTGKGRKVVS